MLTNNVIAEGKTNVTMKVTVPETAHARNLADILRRWHGQT